MRLLHLDDQVVLAFGLHWEQHDAYSMSEHAQIGRWRAQGYRLAARYEHEGGRIYGLHLPQPDEPAVPDRVLAGAGVIATHPALRGRTAIVLFEFHQGGQAALIFVGLRNGVVVADHITVPTELAELRSRFLRDHGAGQVPQTWGSIPGTGVDQAFELTELVPRRGGGRPVRIRPLRSTRPLWTAGFALVLCVLTAAAYWHWRQQSADVARGRASLLAANREPLVRYQKEITALLDRPVHPIGASVAAVRDALAGVPTRHLGWSLQAISCLDGCRLTWGRGSAGVSLEEFRAQAPVGWTSIEAEGLDLIHTHLHLTLPSSRLSPSPSWRTYAEERDHLISLWQTLSPANWQATMGALQQQVAAPDLTNLPLSSAAPLPVAPQAFEIRIADQPWWWADNDAQSPVSPLHLGAQTALSGPIELSFRSGGPTFSLKGLIYVRP